MLLLQLTSNRRQKLDAAAQKLICEKDVVDRTRGSAGKTSLGTQIIDANLICNRKGKRNLKNRAALGSCPSVIEEEEQAITSRRWLLYTYPSPCSFCGPRMSARWLRPWPSYQATPLVLPTSSF